MVGAGTAVKQLNTRPVVASLNGFSCPRSISSLCALNDKPIDPQKIDNQRQSNTCGKALSTKRLYKRGGRHTVTSDIQCANDGATASVIAQR
jgi:hypothetical protein